MSTNDPADAPLTINYVVRYVIPMLTVVIAGVAWCARLEARGDAHEKALVELKAKMEAEEATTGSLKIEQAKLNGQIETLKVMLAQVADTAKRIEAKLDKDVK